ncbi:MAG: hypothetical protein EWV80_01035 [Microcystis aeruginosa Ma_QC_B_20070730_S2]|uniref:Uncharacterized protein n=1 Tax=Microcystis aeruginosa Ma_QC_B_20070730_S2 TaxID=2486256 RepID=A0A552E971_MICAE|nr:MAG: hypothetical protein EWV80_01035 [Microcystis aeruginosa Ma_QC_B_20070730_S2]
MCDNQCLSFVGVLLGKALKTIFLENYPYSSSFHTETRRTKGDLRKNGSSVCVMQWTGFIRDVTLI